MIEISIDSPTELSEVADRVIKSLDGRKIIIFRGGMGAGKTTLIKEIVAQLGSNDNVTSPTFAIINNYTTIGGKQIYHFDFYRINKIEEAYDFGYEEYFFSGDICLVEWPEKIEELLPEDIMTVSITAPSEFERTFKID